MDFIKEAISITTAQASARPMTEAEISSMIKAVALALKAIIEEPAQPAAAPVDAKASIKERSIICLECGKPFKVLTRKHLITHGLTPDEYRSRYGFKKSQALACKSLSRERRKVMGGTKIWERRAKTTEAAA